MSAQPAAKPAPNPDATVEAGAAPDIIARTFQRAATLQREGHLAEATDLYHAILRNAPDHAGAWANLGAVLRQTGKLRPALACYTRALRITPGDPGCLSNLGNALKDFGEIDGALKIHAAAVGKAPDNHGFRFNYAVALKEAGRLRQAFDELERCCDAAPDNPRYRFDRALLDLQLGRYDDGWRGYEARWDLGELSLTHPAARWRGEPFEGKTLLVSLEQGFGDAIFASRFLPLAKRLGGTVVLQCRPQTRRLFENLLGVDAVCGPDDASDADLQCPLMSLPGIFAATPDTAPPLPRLSVPQSAVEKATAVFANQPPALRVGIVWSGSTTFAGNARRAVPFDRFLALANLPGVQLYSLQKGPPAHELADSGAGPLVVDLGPALDDFADTAAIIRQLHVVVMTDSSVAHLAGSLNRPIWNLLDAVPYWLYGTTGQTTPWYPSMRLFRQATRGDWPSVFERVAVELSHWARSL